MRIHSNKAEYSSHIIEGKSAKSNQPSLRSIIQNYQRREPMGYSAKITQFAINQENYEIDNQPRILFYDDTSGHYQSPQADTTIEKKEDRIAIMHETIATRADAEKCITRFQEKQADSPGSPIGLSIIVNAPVDITTQSKDKKSIATNVLNELSITPLPPNVNIEYDVWEKDSEKNTRSQVPYYSLRRRAAVNSGAQALFTDLGKKVDKVWRKMGDSDMPFHSPRDSDDKQIKELSGEQMYKTMLTFGYNLSDSTQDILDKTADSKRPFTLEIDHAKDIFLIIDMIYQKEMELRKLIDYRYTIEPTTYYTMSNEEISKLIPNTPNHKQMREGETFENHLMKGKSEGQHIFNYDIQEKTASGGRNDNLISLLKTKIQSNQFPNYTELTNEIQERNHSAEISMSFARIQ